MHGATIKKIALIVYSLLNSIVKYAPLIGVAFWYSN